MEFHFDGLGMNLGNLSRLSLAETRSISAENPTGGKGLGGMSIPISKESAARELGQGWKVSPCINIPPKGAVTLADIHESGLMAPAGPAHILG
jgi:hypothetical protein